MNGRAGFASADDAAFFAGAFEGLFFALVSFAAGGDLVAVAAATVARVVALGGLRAAAGGTGDGLAGSFFSAGASFGSVLSAGADSFGAAAGAVVGGAVR